MSAMMLASLSGARVTPVPHRRRAPARAGTNAPRGVRAVRVRAAATETEVPLGRQIEDALLSAFPPK
jgi:hypothetical protein